MARTRGKVYCKYSHLSGLMKKAFITGITGQDGSYLAEFLLSRGYAVYGLARSFESSRGYELPKEVVIHEGNLAGDENLINIVGEIKPDEIYHLGAHNTVSFDQVAYTINTIAMGTAYLLEAARRMSPRPKFLQASSAQIFGNAPPPQNEDTPFHPLNPYGCAKACAHWMVENYRREFGLFAANAILFNHESPRRHEMFVTRKIAKAVAGILAGQQDKIVLGNIDTKRDWGYAPDYVDAMWRILQQNSPDDFVLASGEAHSVREFLDEAFLLVGIGSWQSYVEFDPHFVRTAEIYAFVGDASKADLKLGWRPKVKFKELVKIMVRAECNRLKVHLPRA